MTASPRSGDTAPGFELPGTGDRTYRLEDYKGQSVVLVFYPADNSPVCTMQLRSYSENLDGFDNVGAQVLGLSPQSVETHQDFAAKWGLQIPLLSDIDKEVGRAYSILGPLGFYRRSVFVIDPQGIVRFAHRSMTSLTYLPFDDLVAAVNGVEGGAPTP
jgi:peroxiredoxin Q/BCP